MEKSYRILQGGRNKKKSSKSKYSSFPLFLQHFATKINSRQFIFSTTKLYVCPSSFPETNSTAVARTGNTTNTTEAIRDPFGECYRPEYVVFTWILCLVALTSILKLYYLIKTFLAVINVAMYSALLLYYYDVYTINSANNTT